jgi:hypothetical protein
VRALPGAFILLGLVASASAEGAWVLWDNEWRLGSSEAGRWTVTEAFQSKAECARVRLEKVNAPWNQSEAKEGGRQIRFLCLPDSVDPRGPKAK